MNYLDFFNKGKYPQQNEEQFKVGYITGFNQGDQVIKVRFSGETTPVACNVTASFIPFSGVKVLCARTGKSWTILDYVDTKPLQGINYATEISKASSTTFTDVPNLRFYAEANARYEVECRIHYTAVDATADLKIMWTAPTNASWLRNCLGQASNSSDAAQTTMRNSDHNIPTGVFYGTFASTVTYIPAYETGTAFGGDTSGYFQCQFTQNTSSAGAITIRSASYVKWRRVY